VSEPLNLYELLMGEVGEVPVPRSFEETAAAVALAQDRADAPERKRSQQLVAKRQASRQDAAELAAFMGRVRTHADVISDYVAFSDRADAWQQHQAERAAKRAEREREEAQQRRIVDLEAEAAEASTRSKLDMRALRQANEGWAHARGEAASFRDHAYRSSYR
jgi:hypothetical protein